MQPPRTLLNTHLVAHPNGAVVPADEPAVAAARADHLAAGGAVYAGAYLAHAALPALALLHLRPSYRIVSREKPSYRIDIVSSRKKAYRYWLVPTVIPHSQVYLRSGRMSTKLACNKH